MTVVCAIQARMGSTRLPGKVLADLGNRPMLRFMLDRLGRLPVDHLVVATTTSSQDDAVADVAAAAGVDVVRGPEADVLSRYLAVLDAFPADTVVRLTGDCPLVDPVVVEAVLARHAARRADYTSNVLPRTFPKGLDVEVVDAGALRVAATEAVDPGEREHVTPFVYRRPERFRLANLSIPEHLGDERWTVDTPADLATVREVVERLGPDANYGWREVLAVVGRRAPASRPEGVAASRPEGVAASRPEGVAASRPEGVAAPDTLHLRLAGPADSDTFLALRNDPLTVALSTTRSAVDPSAHRRWFSDRLDDPASRLWVATRNGDTVGTLRVQVETGVGQVSIAVDERYRNRGLGRDMLRAGQERVLDDWQVVTLEAVVDPRNEASLRAFTAIGFTPAGTRGDFSVLRWTARAGAPQLIGQDGPHVAGR